MTAVGRGAGAEVDLDEVQLHSGEATPAAGCKGAFDLVPRRPAAAVQPLKCTLAEPVAFHDVVMSVEDALQRGDHPKELQGQQEPGISTAGRLPVIDEQPDAHLHCLIALVIGEHVERAERPSVDVGEGLPYLAPQ